MKTYKYATPENLVVLQFDEDGLCRKSGIRSAFPEDIVIEPADPIPVPSLIVSPRQIRQALTQVNLRSQVEAAVSAGDQDLKDWWEFATQFEEDHPMVVGMAGGLSVTSDQLHSIFELAKSL